MKRIFTLLAGLFIVVAIFSQTPQRISYQAVIRDNTNQLAASQQVGMRISILWGSADGSVVYSETQSPETNHSGLISIEIGVGAGFASIDWSAGPYFIKTETDPSGGSDYTITGISQLLTVPYALHARTAENISGGISVDYSELTGTPVLSTVAESGNYGDLLNTPDLAGIALSGEYNELTGAPVLANIATSGSFNDLQGKPTTIGGYGITDAITTTHAANGISPVDITSWNAAHQWGDHSANGYLTSESDPLFTTWDKSTGITITESQIGDLKNYLTTEADPVFLSHAASGVVSAGSGNVISIEERIKLTGIEAEANNYVHPVTHPASMVVEEVDLRFMTDAERTKLAAVEAEANKYIHPGTHPASMVVEEANLRFMTDAERTKLEGIEAGAQVNVKADWNALAGSEAEILNRPVLANIATSGSFNDLQGKPTTIDGYGITDAFSGSYNDLANQPSLSGYAKKDMNNENIINLATPVNDMDAANKSYVDGKVKTYQIDDFVHGGVVFWIDETGQHGLVAAIEDQHTGIQWGLAQKMNTTISGIYSGKMNTTILVAVHTAKDFTGNYAALVCSHYSGGGFGDWYLPSEDEIKLMLSNNATLNTAAIANGGTAINNGQLYWSSSDYDASMGRLWYANGGGAASTSTSKSTNGRVRAIRAF